MKNAHGSRAESEKKGKVTSIRLTEYQHRKVQEQAKAKGMTVSNYIITTAVNGGNAVTPEFIVKLQNITNEACSVMEESAPDSVTAMQEEVNEIWQKLALLETHTVVSNICKKP